MIRPIPTLVLTCLLTSAAFAQMEYRDVILKVYPPESELFLQGKRIGYQETDSGLRVYRLPNRDLRLTLGARDFRPLSFPLAAGKALAEVKLEPNSPVLELRGETGTGRAPRSLAFSGDGRKIFVSADDGRTLEVYDRDTLKQLGKTSLEPAWGSIGDLHFSKEKNELWAAATGGQLLGFDPAGSRVREILTWGGQGTVTIDDVGQGILALVAQDEARVYLFDTAAKKTLKTIESGGGLRGAASDGKNLYLTRFDTGRVAVASWESARVQGVLEVGGAPRPIASAQQRLFIGDMASGQVLVMKTDSTGIQNRLNAGSNPHVLAVSPNGRLLAVVLRGRNNPEDYTKEGPDFGKILLFSTETLEKLGEVSGRNQPTGLAFSADSKYLVFSDLLDNNLELYRINF